MSTIAIAALLVLGTAYAVAAVKFMFEFSTYCARVSEVTNCTEENGNYWNADESGLNAFQLWQLRKLRNGSYAQLPDPTLVVRGRILARQERLLRWSAIGLVVAVWAIHAVTR